MPGAENGCLVITPQKENYIDRKYTSGRINTAGKASWGPGHRIVARVYPRDVKQMGQGFAFWMMPDEIPVGWDYIMWPQGGEVDIMEYVGSILDNSMRKPKEALVDYERYIDALDRLPEKKESNHGVSIRAIVEDRIITLKEELFFKDEL